LIGTFDVDFIEPAALLFQTGYLTIKGKKTTWGKNRIQINISKLRGKKLLK